MSLNDKVHSMESAPGKNSLLKGQVLSLARLDKVQEELLYYPRRWRQH